MPINTSAGDEPATLLQRFVVIVHYVYPIALLVFYLTALTAWGIKTSKKKIFTPPPSIAPSKVGTPARPSSPLLGTGGHHGIFSRSKRRSRVRSEEMEDYENKGRLALWLSGHIERLGENTDGVKGGLTPLRKAILNWMFVAVICTFFANSANIILHALVKEGWWCGQDVVISTVLLLFIYTLILLSQIDNARYPTVPHVLSWNVGMFFEIVLLASNMVLWTNHSGKSFQMLSSWKFAALSIDMTRILLLLGMTGLYAVFVIFAEYPEQNGEGENSGLLPPSRASTGYGSIAETTKGTQEEQGPAWARRNLVGVRQSWWEYLHGYTVFFPYLWPSKSRRLQVVMVVCFVLMLAQRVVNVLVPNQLGKVTNELSENKPLPWVQISLYIAYRFMQGNMGILGALRSTLWIPIGQYSYNTLSTSAFEHVHSLSLDFHLGKKTGEVLSALSKGSSINTFLEQVTFQVIPMLVDLGVAVGYFFIKFDAYYALIVAIVTFCYLYITIRMAQWRADIRRQMVNKSREEDAVKNDSMVAYETVKYFNAENYEFTRYRNAVNAYQSAEYKVLFSLNIMNVTQNLMFMIGLLIACFLSAYQVSTGQTKVGSFVALLTYMAQLQGPLNFFGTFYRSIQSSMINSERMLELFRERPTVVDEPNARELRDFTGEVKFEDVYFSYDSRKPALQGLDFTASPGTTTAFVGESGGGKTTILRLLFRFYNAESGSIKFDGQDVRDLTIDSVREKIGVVPQDTVLFNETIMYNLKYANPKATDEMVYEACRAAAIHDKILAFPDGYNTKVGERGLRLSGGEKQRVAIARTILKNPKVILLDEATAALDSETEQHIQAALKELTRGRTTLVIAHRLSTIVTADQILCIHAGQVVERGTHEELLALKGRYYTMWNKQVRAQRAQERLAKAVEAAKSDATDGSSESHSSETESSRGRRAGKAGKRNRHSRSNSTSSMDSMPSTQGKALAEDKNERGESPSAVLNKVSGKLMRVRWGDDRVEKEERKEDKQDPPSPGMGPSAS